MKSLEKGAEIRDSWPGKGAPLMGHQSCEEAEALGRQVGVGFALEI
jgi:hypothetical protein